jgi:lipoate-protein ligase A
LGKIGDETMTETNEQTEEVSSQKVKDKRNPATEIRKIIQKDLKFHQLIKLLRTELRSLREKLKEDHPFQSARIDDKIDE